MSKFTPRNLSKLMVLKKLKTFLKIAAVAICLGSSLASAANIDQSINGAVASKDDAKFNCSTAYISGAGKQSLVAPFNSTICPKDDTVQVAYMFLPHVMEKAADILHLDYRKEIKEYFEISEYSGAHVGNFEQVVSVVRSIAIWFISIILCFQILAAGIKSLTDGHLGGISWGNFGVTTAFCTGVIFLLPIGNHMYVGELILACMFLIGLGICNMGISTVLYTIGHGADQTHVLGGEGINGSILAYNDRHVRDVSDGDTRTPIEIGQHVGDMHAVRYIEANMCVKQTAKIIGLNYIKDNDHWYDHIRGVGKIDGLLGYVETPSYINDNNATSVEIQKNGNKAIVNYGVNIDQTGSGAAAGVGSGLCSSEIVSYPSLLIATDNKFLPIYTDGLKKQIESNVISGAELLADASAQEHQESVLAGKLSKLLMELNRSVLDAIAKYNESHSSAISASDTLEALHSLSDYFYKRIIFEIQTGGDNTGGKISTYSSHYYGLVNGYSHEIDNGVVGGDCFNDYEGYRNTKATIKALNAGEMPNEEGFDLKCANIDNSGFAMSFNANTDSYESFAKSIKSIMDAGGGTELIPKNYGALTKYLGNIFGAIYISRRNNENSVGSETQNAFVGDKDDKISDTAYTILKEIREHGFPRFGMQFLSLFRETEDTYYSDHKTVPSMMPVFNTLYSANTGYVSSAVSTKNKVGYVPNKILMPSDFYNVVGGSSYANTADIQSAIMSKIGSMDSGGDGGNSGNLGGVTNGSSNLKTMGDMSTIAWQKALETAIYLLPVLAIPSSVLTAHTASAVTSISKDSDVSSVDSRYASPVDIKYALEDLCRGNNSLGDVKPYIAKHVCDRYNRHPLVYYQDMGNDLIQSVAVLSLAYIGGAMAGTIAKKKLQSLYNKQLELQKKSANSASIDAVGDGGKSALAALIKGKGIAATKVLFDSLTNVAKLMSGMFVYVVMLLLLIGVLFGYVMPVLPYLVFSLAWLNYILMFLQFIAVSMMIFSAMVLFSGNDSAVVLSKKGLVNSFINLVLRPIACIIAFSVGWSLAYAALQAMDSVSLMIIGNFSDTMNFDSMSINLLFAMFFVGMAQFAVIKWVFSTTMKLPNTIINHLSGDGLDDGNGVLGRILAARVALTKNKAKASFNTANAATAKEMQNGRPSEDQKDGDDTDPNLDEHGRFKDQSLRGTADRIAQFGVKAYESVSTNGVDSARNMFDKMMHRERFKHDDNMASKTKQSSNKSKRARESDRSNHSEDNFDFPDNKQSSTNNSTEGVTGANSKVRNDDQVVPENHRSGMDSVSTEPSSENNLNDGAKKNLNTTAPNKK